MHVGNVMITSPDSRPAPAVTLVKDVAITIILLYITVTESHDVMHINTERTGSSLDMT
jgi:hypothetical protein